MIILGYAGGERENDITSTELFPSCAIIIVTARGVPLSTGQMGGNLLSWIQDTKLLFSQFA